MHILWYFHSSAYFWKGFETFSIQQNNSLPEFVKEKLINRKSIQ